MPRKKQSDIWLQLRKCEMSAISMMNKGMDKPAKQFLKHVIRLNEQHAHAYYLLSIIQFRQRIENINCKSMDKNKEKWENYYEHAKYLNKFHYQMYVSPHKIIKKAVPLSFIMNTPKIYKLTERLQKMEQSIEALNNKFEKEVISAWSQILDIYHSGGDICGAQFFSTLIIQTLNSCKQQHKILLRANSPKLSHIGVVLYELGLYKQAYFVIQLIAQLVPNSIFYMNNLSILCYLLGKYDKCEELTNKSTELDSNFMWTMYIKCYLYEKIGKLKEGLYFIRKCRIDDETNVSYCLKEVSIIAKMLMLDEIQLPNKVEDDWDQDWGDMIPRQQIRVKLERQMHQCISKSIQILVKKENSDKVLMPTRYEPMALKAIQFIAAFCDHIGISPHINKLFMDYMDRFNDFMFSGKGDKTIIFQEVSWLEDKIRKSYFPRHQQLGLDLLFPQQSL